MAELNKDTSIKLAARTLAGVKLLGSAGGAWLQSASNGVSRGINSLADCPPINQRANELLAHTETSLESPEVVRAQLESLIHLAESIAVANDSSLEGFSCPAPTLVKYVLDGE